MLKAQQGNRPLHGLLIYVHMLTHLQMPAHCRWMPLPLRLQTCWCGCCLRHSHRVPQRHQAAPQLQLQLLPQQHHPMSWLMPQMLPVVCCYCCCAAAVGVALPLQLAASLHAADRAAVLQVWWLLWTALPQGLSGCCSCQAPAQMRSPWSRRLLDCCVRLLPHCCRLLLLPLPYPCCPPAR